MKESTHEKLCAQGINEGRAEQTTGRQCQAIPPGVQTHGRRSISIFELSNYAGLRITREDGQGGRIYRKKCATETLKFTYNQQSVTIDLVTKFSGFSTHSFSGNSLLFLLRLL